MNRKRVYLHIGLHKTGTSSIQVALRRQALDLRKLDCHVPSLGPDYPYHHALVEDWVQLGERFRLGQDTQSVWASLVADIDAVDAQSVVLSSEELSNRAIDDERIAFIAERLAGHDVYVVACLRRQDDFLESAYKEVKKHREWAGLQTYWRESAAAALQLDYIDLVQRWERHFGVGRVRLIDYHRIVSGEIGLLQSFCEACDLPSDALQSAEAVHDNRSDSSLDIAFKDWFGLRDASGFPRRLVDFESRLDVYLQENGLRLTVVPSALREELRSRFISGNARLDMIASDYFLGTDDLEPIDLESLFARDAVRELCSRTLLESQLPLAA